MVFRKELEQYSRQVESRVEGDAAEDEEVESLLQGGVARPDLLAAHHAYHGDTLMQEIAQKEGMSSPLIRQEHVLQPSPFLRSHRSGSMRRSQAPVVTAPSSNLKSRAALSMSLPNLADVDSLEAALAPPTVRSNRYSVLLPSQM